MTPLRRSAAVLGLVAAFAWPAGALAQGSAGDDQYQDPFGAGQGTKKRATPPAQPMPKLAAPAPGTAPLGGTGTSSAPGSTAIAAVPPSASPPTVTAAELPRTGADPLLEALAGAGLLLTGLGVRLRTRGA